MNVHDFRLQIYELYVWLLKIIKQGRFKKQVLLNGSFPDVLINNRAPAQDSDSWFVLSYFGKYYCAVCLTRSPEKLLICIDIRKLCHLIVMLSDEHALVDLFLLHFPVYGTAVLWERLRIYK